MPVTAKNPIISGFYPDPSICAVGEDFYLVNSTFSYFPGLPIFHSKDLAHWEQIGNVLDRKVQIPLEHAGHSAGLFAPTIRYHEGIYYVICTNVSCDANFIVTATRPQGPWSAPYYLQGADGIDPSLFFDDDGKCYYIGTHSNPEGCRYNGDNYIWIQELDLDKMELVGEVHNVWNGALRNIVWPEGPHLYKKDGYYYIINAEGGTGPHHSVTVCRSRELFGPYENNFCNPILTHRHLGHDYPIQCVGHADMVEATNGEWYMVMLAVRPIGGYTTLGRETFLAKVTWENGWPVVNSGEGRLTDKVEVNLPEWKPSSQADIYTKIREYDFCSMKRLSHEFVMLRNPDKDMYVLKSDKGLGLMYGSATLRDEASPSYVAVRQQHHHFTAIAVLSTDSISSNKNAGMALVQSNEYNLRIEMGRIDEEAFNVNIIKCCQGVDNVVATKLIKATDSTKQVEIVLKVEGLSASVWLITSDNTTPLVEGIDIHWLSTEVAGGFVGCTVGMYAASARKDISNVEGDRAYFKRFIYCNEEAFS